MLKRAGRYTYARARCRKVEESRTFRVDPIVIEWCECCSARMGSRGKQQPVVRRPRFVRPP
jgi:hypothetical protein